MEATVCRVEQLDFVSEAQPDAVKALGRHTSNAVHAQDAAAQIKGQNYTVLFSF